MNDHFNKISMMNLVRKEHFIAATAALTVLSGCSPEKNRIEQPNFIIIQMDDLGYSDLGIHGNELVKTPYLDSFARKSVQFSNYYVNPVCAPTRASLLTGRHFLKTGVSHVHGGKDHLHLSEQTFGDIFREAGYATGMWGKWHSGTAEGYLPWQRGFEEAYKAQLYQHRNSFGSFNGQAVQTGKWADDAICDYALDFIRRNSEKPFVAYMSFLTCHSPLDAPEELINGYESAGLSRNLSTLYAMIEHADSSLGMFLNELEKMDIYDNTVIFFMSDNGPAIKNGTLDDEDRKIRYVNRLTGHKGNIWENGIKSPLFVYQAGKYENSRVGSLADVTDILPTMMDLAGIEIGEHIDGISLAPLLEGEKPGKEKLSFNYANPAWPPTNKPWTPEGVLDEYRPLTDSMKAILPYDKQVITVRKGNMKLLLNPAPYEGTPVQNNNYVLVDICEDPQERTNLIKDKPEEFESLRKDLESWFMGIKKSNHSFEMPWFLVEKGKTNEILAKGPARISPDLKNSFNYLGGWEKGSEATYNLRVMQSAEFSIELEFTTEVPAETNFRLVSSSGNSVNFSPGKDENALIGFSPEDHSFSLQCTSTKEPGFGLISIIFK